MSELSDPGGTSTRGRRNPQVAAEIAAARAREAQPITRDGVPEFVDGSNLPFGADPFADEQDLQTPESAGTLLGEGAVVMAKRATQAMIDGNEHWFTLGVQDRVYPGEDDADALGRIAEFINTGTNDLIAGAEEGIRAENTRRYEEERRAHITPRTHR